MGGGGRLEKSQEEDSGMQEVVVYITRDKEAAYVVVW